MQIIEATGLVKRYGEIVALDGLDLSVPEGTVFGLLGPNGAGKTTAVSVLTTLIKPDAGSATVAGVDVLAHPDEVRKRIGLSGQSAAVDENLTGFENLDMIGRLYRLGKVPERGPGRGSCWSGSISSTPPIGRSRPTRAVCDARLDLAGALVAESPVLFLDEPTTGLDPRSRIDLWSVIRELVEHGTTLLAHHPVPRGGRSPLPTTSWSSTTGTPIAHGTSDELKDQIGGERIEVTATHHDQVSEAMTVLAEFAVAEMHSDPKTGFAARSHRWWSSGAHQSTSRPRRCRNRGQRRGAAKAHTRRRLPVSDRTCSRRSRAARVFPRGVLMSRILYALADGAVVAKRNVIKIKRVPEVLVFVLISPIMFVLLFAYVFGASIDIPGGSYREFLIAGIFAQTVVFGATFTGAGLAEDMQKGIIDRFRALPMSRSAVLVGRTASDVIYNVLSLLIMALTGLLVGWRANAGLLNAVFGLRLAALVRLRLLMGHGVRRTAGAEPRGDQQRLVHGDLPADVRCQHLRTVGEPARPR